MSITDKAYIWGEEMRGFLGFHGTNSKEARIIERTNFILSKSGWLGRGAYFFENNYVLARDWATFRQRGQTVSVLECNIQLDPARIFDISHPENEDTIEFHETREELIKIMIENQLDLHEEKKSLDAKVIDLICKNKGKLLVRAFTYTYQPLDRSYNLGTRINNGIELCVKNPGIIRNKKII
ncbi:hypothetical protein [Psychrobacillus psychrotolerans]|uniref:hypothetical protein n=1 Tax=Psychrobacillus psychrotolerans TaxID=126156 RepID=UPI0033163BCA